MCYLTHACAKVSQLTQRKPDDHVCRVGGLWSDETAFVDGLVVEGQPREARQRRPLLDEHLAIGLAGEVVGEALRAGVELLHGVPAPVPELRQKCGLMLAPRVLS